MLVINELAFTIDMKRQGTVIDSLLRSLTGSLLVSLIVSRVKVSLWASVSLCLLLMVSQPSNALNWEERRQHMVDEIREDAVATAFYIGKKSFEPKVMAAINFVPRHEFVPLFQLALAYRNTPLSIGYGQTISQPYIVALMTDMLQPKPDHKVLEVGTGSGYQAAVLSRLVSKVYSIEIIPELSNIAEQRLERLGYSNVQLRIGDGFYGWPKEAPFDSIIVTAAGGQIPPPLVRQLKPGGRMVIPVGSPYSVQHLMMVEKNARGEVSVRQVLPVRFVPLTGSH